MYELDDTIAAVSSPLAGQRAIVRISGPETLETAKQLFSPAIPQEQGGLFTGHITIDAELKIDAKLYLFLSPYTYTGDDVAEIHLDTSSAVSGALMSKLLSSGLRMAGPGEFTARAYLNGKMDLSQAEAVNEVVVSSNKFQLAASEKLLSGRLGQTTSRIRSQLMDCLSLIEAGLDFSGEDIEFISRSEAVEKLNHIKNELEGLLRGSISYEEVVDLPAVGIAGAPNAGKSSLLNKLLGVERSIVSEVRKTTRDVLTGVLTLAHCKCLLFDCAGLAAEPDGILDELAQRAAIEALRNSSLVIFCVDIAKADWGEDISIRNLVQPRSLLWVATKSDLPTEEVLTGRLCKLNKSFDAEFLPTSVVTGTGIELLRETVDRKLLDTRYSMLDARRPSKEQGVSRIEHSTISVALMARHKQAVTEAIENVIEAANELKEGSDEIGAMMLRSAYQSLGDIESAIGQAGRTDEQILARIFSRFCIGK
jgi:tRNA modification GTPase